MEKEILLYADTFFFVEQFFFLSLIDVRGVLYLNKRRDGFEGVSCEIKISSIKFWASRKKITYVHVRRYIRSINVEWYEKNFVTIMARNYGFKIRASACFFFGLEA